MTETLTIETITQKIHDATGWEGKKLMEAVFFFSMIRADLFGNKAIGDYFQRRMRDCQGS